MDVKPESVKAIRTKEDKQVPLNSALRREDGNANQILSEEQTHKSETPFTIDLLDALIPYWQRNTSAYTAFRELLADTANNSQKAKNVFDELVQALAKRGFDIDLKEKFYKAYQDADGKVWNGVAAMRNSNVSNPALLTPRKKLTQPDAKGYPIYYEPSNKAYIMVHQSKNVIFNDNARAAYTMALLIFTKAIFQDADVAAMCLYVDDFMKARGFTSERKATETLATAIRTLAFTRVNVEVIEKVRDDKGKVKLITSTDKVTGEKKTTAKPEVKKYNVPLLGSVELKRGNEKDPIGFTPRKFKDADGRCYFKVSLDMDLAKNLAYSPIMPYYVQLLKLDFQKFPHAMTLANKLSIYDNINRQHNNTKQIGIIGVLGLLECMDLQPYEDRQRTEKKIKPNGKEVIYTRNYGNWRTEYLEPLEKNLDALEKIGFLKWEWCNKNKKTLSDEQLKDYLGSYEAFCSLYVLYELNIKK